MLSEQNIIRLVRRARIKENSSYSVLLLNTNIEKEDGPIAAN
jgi:hypothetical protein